jgi:Protein of unknown function (DUF3261)
MRSALVLVLGVVGGCGGARSMPQGERSEAIYPGVLHPPSELSPDLVVEQHVEASKDGQTGSFDAVVQKRGGELLMVGLGPMGIRAFVIKQVGTAIEVEQRMGPRLPFPARNVVVDVHRVFFKRLVVSDGAPDGELRGQIDDEDVVELWHEGSLVERRFSRPRERSGAVRVTYGPGCGVTRCEPATVRLVNEWFGYELRIDNRRYHALE